MQTRDLDPELVDLVAQLHLATLCSQAMPAIELANSSRCVIRVGIYAGGRTFIDAAKEGAATGCDRFAPAAGAARGWSAGGHRFWWCVGDPNSNGTFTLKGQK